MQNLNSPTPGIALTGICESVELWKINLEAICK